MTTGTANLAGAYTAIVTPFTDTGDVDFNQLTANIEFQIENGIDGIVPVGTTGESPTLTHPEHQQVIEHCVKTVDGCIGVVAGTGSNSTAEALELTQFAAKAGADAALIVNPYYNKPTQEGLYAHCSKLADEGNIDILLYNIPGRTAVTIAPETMARLAQHERIIGVKEATGSMDIASEVASLTDRASFAITSGDDSATLPLMSIGGIGVISVLANLMPAQIKALVQAASDGNWEDARAKHLELFALCKGCLTMATNPIPIKAAMKLAGMDSGFLRLPMTPLPADGEAKLKAMLSEAGVV